jgi:hypothetical protein
MTHAPHPLRLRASLDLLSADQGGRSGPLVNGSRPALWFGDTDPAGQPRLHSCVLTLPSGDAAEPGGRYSVELTPVAFGTWPAIHKGTAFDVMDGLRVVGRGAFAALPPASELERELRQSLAATFHDWVFDRFREKVSHSSAVGPNGEPDLIAWFPAIGGKRHVVVVEVVARRPRKKDVERLMRLMKSHDASFGVVIGAEGPSHGARELILALGTVDVGERTPVPRVRALTSADLLREDVSLLPAVPDPERVEVRPS